MSSYPQRVAKVFHPFLGAPAARSRRGLWKGICLAAATVTVSLLPLGSAHAQQTLAGSIAVKMVLTSGCVISGGSGATSGVNFGDLNFGSHPSSFTGVVTANVTNGDGGAGTTQIICSPNVTSYTVTVGPGLHAGQGSTIGVGSRAMANGTTYLPYEVYQDAGYLTPYPLGTASPSITVVTAGAPFTLPIYGRVNKTNPVALTPGNYTDTLQVTLTF